MTITHFAQPMTSITIFVTITVVTITILKNCKFIHNDFCQSAVHSFWAILIRIWSPPESRLGKRMSNIFPHQTRGYVAEICDAESESTSPHQKLLQAGGTLSRLASKKITMSGTWNARPSLCLRDTVSPAWPCSIRSRGRGRTSRSLLGLATCEVGDHHGYMAEWTNEWVKIVLVIRLLMF